MWHLTMKILKSIRSQHLCNRISKNILIRCLITLQNIFPSILQICILEKEVIALLKAYIKVEHSSAVFRKCVKEFRHYYGFLLRHDVCPCAMSVDYTSLELCY